MRRIAWFVGLVAYASAWPVCGALLAKDAVLGAYFGFLAGVVATGILALAWLTSGELAESD